jgi:hypothetical protein
MALSEFQKAFKAARASGEKEFEFEGKKYNTKYKEEAESSVKKAEPEVKKSGTPDLPVTKAEASEKTSPPEKKTGIGPYNAFSGVGDYLNKTFTMEGREQAKKEAKERFGMKKGGTVRSSASSRADGIAQRGKTKGRIC